MLSPIIFLLHINDLLSLISDPIHSFADDSTLHSNFSSKHQPPKHTIDTSRTNLTSSLTNDLSKILKWGSLNLVNFNPSKTQSCIFSRKHNRSTIPLQLSSNTKPPSSSLSMLGVTFSSDLTWHDHISSIAKSASKKLGFLFRAKHYFTPPQL